MPTSPQPWHALPVHEPESTQAASPPEFLSSCNFPGSQRAPFLPAAPVWPRRPWGFLVSPSSPPFSVSPQAPVPATPSSPRHLPSPLNHPASTTSSMSRPPFAFVVFRVPSRPTGRCFGLRISRRKTHHLDEIEVVEGEVETKRRLKRGNSRRIRRASKKSFVVVAKKGLGGWLAGRHGKGATAMGDAPGGVGDSDEGEGGGPGSGVAVAAGGGGGERE